MTLHELKYMKITWHLGPPVCGKKSIQHHQDSSHPGSPMKTLRKIEPKSLLHRPPLPNSTSLVLNCALLEVDLPPSQAQKKLSVKNFANKPQFISCR